MKLFILLFITSTSFAQNYCPELNEFLQKRNLLLEDDRIKIQAEQKVSKLDNYSSSLSYLKKLTAGRTSLGAFTFLKNTGSEAKALDAKVAELASKHSDLFNDFKREEGQLKTLQRTFTGLQDGKELTTVQKTILQDAEDELKLAQRRYTHIDKSYTSAKEARKLISRKYIKTSIKNSEKPLIEAGRHAGKYLQKSF